MKTMERIIRIKQCSQCLNESAMGLHSSLCSIKNKEIPDAHHIPEWCSLEVAPIPNNISAKQMADKEKLQKIKKVLMG